KFPIPPVKMTRSAYLRFSYLILLSFIAFTYSCSVFNVEKANYSSRDTIFHFTNPIAASAEDPWVIKKDSFYYYCHTDQWNRLCVSKSRVLHELGENKVVWTAPREGWNRSNIWAPELHYFNNKWYIYYAAGK